LDHVADGYYRVVNRATGRAFGGPQRIEGDQLIDRAGQATPARLETP
jgi:hypothetical protein